MVDDASETVLKAEEAIEDEDQGEAEEVEVGHEGRER